MPDTTGRIRTKALDKTGITEPMLEKHWAHGAGQVIMAVVELRTVEPHGPTLEGKKRIDYVIEAIEPVPAAQEDVVRRLQRAIYATRPEVEGQAVLKGTADGPTVADVARDVEGQIETDTDGNPVGVWDGNPDAPVPADDEVAAKRKGKRTAAETCPNPACALPIDHDGDHSGTA